MRIGLLVLLGLGCALKTQAQVPAEATPAPRIFYVEDFEAHAGGSEGGGTSRSGTVSSIRGIRASQTTVKNAGSLSGAIVGRFKTAGYAAQRIPRGAPLPKDGWLVTGIFYSIDTQTGRMQMPSFLTGEPDPPNTQVTVSVADLALNPAAPFIVFGTAEALRGQGPPVGWNPYVVAAKFVVGKVESSADITKLATEIVDTILKSKATIEEKSRAQAN